MERNLRDSELPLSYDVGEDVNPLHVRHLRDQRNSDLVVLTEDLDLFLQRRNAPEDRDWNFNPTSTIAVDSSVEHWEALLPDLRCASPDAHVLSLRETDDLSVEEGERDTLVSDLRPVWVCLGVRKKICEIEADLKPGVVDELLESVLCHNNNVKAKPARLSFQTVILCFQNLS